MKKIFTLCMIILVSLFTNAQVVLNEIYTTPGIGKHEFFEFYNTNPSITPQNMDNFTILSYYEDGLNSGFYVMDLPNQTIPHKGYYVGAAANPFNVQGQTGVSADFSWNAMPAGGYLKKFQKVGAIYTEMALPANFNDFFYKRSGSGAVQHIFVFKNGILVNGIFTGTNKATIPSYIAAMPPLFVDMSGSSPDFLINFNGFQNNQFEYVVGTDGNDNGYTRFSDGKCGVWDKSTSTVTHTPGQKNGGAEGVSGNLTISFFITEISGDPTKSLLVYNVTSSTLSSFPVVVEVYRDMGVISQLDGLDELVDSREIYTLTEGDQYVVMPTRNDPAILVAKSPSGCFDLVAAIPNNLSTLPVHLLRFQGNMNKNNKVTLNWTVADNETVSYFELEKSVNGSAFTKAAVVFASEKRGVEDYMYFETINSNEKVMYRLKMFDKGQDVDYSKILVFQQNSGGNDIRIIGNPVKDKLTFSYTSAEKQTVNFRVYDMSGRTIMTQQVNMLEGNNILSHPLNASLKSGMYILEVSDGTNRQTAKFVKL